MEFNDELIQIFNEEVTDLIERSRNSLDNFLLSENKIEKFKDVLRVIHTIKGNAGTIGYNDIRKYSHDLETSLLEFKNNENKVDKSAVDKIIKFFDYVESIISGEVVSPYQEPDPSQEKKDFEIFEKVEASVEKKEMEIFSKEEEKPKSLALNKNKETNNLEKMEIKENKNSKNMNDYIRVPTDRLQKNFDVISEIFLIRNQMRYLVEKYAAEGVYSDLFFQDWEILDNSLRKSIGELEGISMSMRMTPIKSLLRRMEKTIRSYLETSSDKDIRVEIEGEDVEIDKKIIDSLAEPLIHLTRNAMDHGIETKQERINLGKDPQAVIKFEIQIVANEAILCVSDDGRGIDENNVLKSAIKKGLNVSNVQTKEEIINLIFLPGFSTVEKVSDVSGRGIGMDAVKTYVESIGGNLGIKTEIGKGTEFNLKLPLGMSVVPVIIAKANNIKFAILNSEVLELKKINPKEVIQNGNERYYKRGNEFIKCINIEDGLFSHLKKESDFYDQKEKLSICIIGQTGKLIAVQIGEFLENAEIVVKEYPSSAPKFNYVSGISILATGEPTFLISLNKYCEKNTNMIVNKKSGEL
ncbi:hypothetical protein GCL60_00770 [Silvanigrella paludirubra]|uniref:histidine kinase n=1 Tax=Silvanigrella paludirubra TaxID=2499159 RepID=A0A6N6VV71_9BACT|nr:ATP-binding protein [Silvanigrella paludirubra]KAB8040480.1 hypothetical protein GCL60_00770 [Silvanigrella paludirubra]